MAGITISPRRAISVNTRARYSLVILTLIGAGLRFYQLGTQSIWFDEAYSLYVASHSVWDIIIGIEPSHLPFYFVLLKGWILLFGQTEVAVRLLSLVFGVALIPALFLLARRLFGFWVGLFTSLFAVISPFFVYYSHETRPYELLALQAVITTYLLVRSLQEGKWWWVAYGLTTASMLYTHYYGGLFFGAQTIFVVIWLLFQWREKQMWSTARSWIVVEVALAIAFLPWMLQRAMLFNSYVTGDAGSSSSADFMFWKTVTSFTTGHSVETLNPSLTDPSYLVDHSLAIWLSIGFLVVALLGVVGSIIISREHTPDQNTLESPKLFWQPWLLPVVLIIVTSLAVYIATGSKRGFTSRYIISLAPFFYLLVGSGLEMIRRHAILLLVPIIALLAGTMLFALNNYYNDPKYAREDFRATATYIQEHANQREAIVCDASNTQLSLDYYYHGAAPRITPSERLPLAQADAEATLSALAQQNDFIWLVSWQDYYSDPERNLEHWLDSHAILKTQEAFHGGIRVRGYMTAPPIIAEGTQPNARFDYLENKLALVGYQFSPAVSGQDWNVELYFKVLAPLEKDYTLFKHLVSLDGQAWTLHDAQPYDGHYPTSHWEPGKIVKIEESIKLPAFSPTCDYRLEVGFYDLATMKRLGSDDKTQFVIEPIHIAAGKEVMPKETTSSNTDFGGQMVLRGFALDKAHPKERILLTTYWQILKASSPDYTVFVHLLDQQGNVVAKNEATPGLAAFPTSQWAGGQTVVDFRSLPVPKELPSGSYRLVVGVYDSRDIQRLTAKPHFWDSPQDVLELGTISIP